MDLLFKREQTSETTGRVKFRLWSKVEFDDEEQQIIRRYRFDQTMLIEAVQPNLFRQSLFVFGAVFFVINTVAWSYVGLSFAMMLGVLLGGVVGFWYFNEYRESVFVKDLIHGRYFSCPSVVELARKEAWLEMVTAYLRQVMESAKHWDGTQRHSIQPLPKDQARKVILSGL